MRAWKSSGKVLAPHRSKKSENRCIREDKRKFHFIHRSLHQDGTGQGWERPPSPRFPPWRKGQHSKCPPSQLWGMLPKRSATSMPQPEAEATSMADWTVVRLLPDYTWLLYLYFIKPQRHHQKTGRTMNKFSKVIHKINIQNSTSIQQNERCWWLPGHKCWRKWEDAGHQVQNFSYTG